MGLRRKLSNDYINMINVDGTFSDAKRIEIVCKLEKSNYPSLSIVVDGVERDRVNEIPWDTAKAYLLSAGVDVDIFFEFTIVAERDELLKTFVGLHGKGDLHGTK